MKTKIVKKSFPKTGDSKPLNKRNAAMNKNITLKNKNAEPYKPGPKTKLEESSEEVRSKTSGSAKMKLFPINRSDKCPINDKVTTNQTIVLSISI